MAHGHCQWCGAILGTADGMSLLCAKCRNVDLGKLSNQALRGHVMMDNSISVVPPDPAAYRLRRDSYGGLVLQGLFALQGDPRKRIWRDIETVDTDLPEEAE